MFWTIMEIPSGSLFFGYLSESQTVLLFGIILVALTIGIRWIIKKYEQSEDKTNEIVKR